MLNIRDMPSKTTVRYHLLPKLQKIPRISQDMEKMEPYGLLVGILCSQVENSLVDLKQYGRITT